MIDDPRVERVLEELLESGRSPEEACRTCPELLPRVRSELQRLRQLEHEVDAIFPSSKPRNGILPADVATAELPSIRGYEVQAVLGRGGMGVVYRALHLRLGRPVALKMLLAGPYAGPEERERFQREAEAVAGLRHASIVQLYDAGDLDGRPYFTMELVEGGSLARKIAGMPQPARRAGALLMQVAQAVEFAHKSGVVHRDLTPANILMASDGTPKVTDFGLARRLEGDSGLTFSGVPMGTPSYMAPEQARGEKAGVGPVTDVYALGAILYEMLTGRPPFRAETSSGTLQQVLHEDPVPLSRLNPQVPRDLATICLKCLSKEPHRRYASAAALAEDLGRFLRGESIAARPAGPMERLARWARRSPAAAALLAITLLVATTVLGAGGWLIGRQVFTARAVRADLREADRLQQQSALSEAGATLEQARSRLGEGGPFWLYPVVEAARRDHRFLVRLEAIRLNRFTLVVGQRNHAAQLRFNRDRADRDYAEAFRDQGLGEPPDDPEGAAALVRASNWATPIVAALDDWAVCAADPARQDWLLDVARRADPDTWRDRVRDPAAWRDGMALAELARTAPVAVQPIPLLLALGERLSAIGDDGITFRRRVREQDPNDFWANFTLALAVHATAKQQAGDPALALVYYESALKIRPQAVAVRNDLGIVLFDKGWLWDKERDEGPGALGIFYQVMKSDPDFAPAFNNIGAGLKVRGDWPMAALMYQDALRIDPRMAPAHFNFGEILAGSGKLNEAIDHFRQALGVDPDFGLAHHHLGVALLAKSRRDEVDECYPLSVKPVDPARYQALNEAIAHHWYALYSDPAWTPGRNSLCLAPQEEARLKEALDHFRQAVRLEPDFDLSHGALAEVLFARRAYTEAEAEVRRGLALIPAGPNGFRDNLGRQLQRCQRLRALESRLPAVVQGKDRPEVADCLDMAELCCVEHHYATAARLYAEALTTTPRLTEDLRAGHRFNAARAAGLAGGGHGDDASGFGEPQREALRRQSREWLRLDLAGWAKKADSGTRADRIQACKTLAAWRDDPDLDVLRDPAALAELPPAERQECGELWSHVDALIDRLKGPE
jgi:serine/threonine-protein kinase